MDHLTGHGRRELNERNSRGLRTLKPTCRRPCLTYPSSAKTSIHVVHQLPETSLVPPLTLAICGVHSLLNPVQH